MSEEEAAAIVWSLTSPEMHRLLRVDRAWTVERYSGMAGRHPDPDASALILLTAPR